MLSQRRTWMMASTLAVAAGVCLNLATSSLLRKAFSTDHVIPNSVTGTESLVKITQVVAPPFTIPQTTQKQQYTTTENQDTMSSASSASFGDVLKQASTMSAEQRATMAKQGSHPEGEVGVEVGRRMHQANLDMITASIDALGPLSNTDVVLELGHGACQHLPMVFDKATSNEAGEGPTYLGLEVSETMFQEATKNNQEFITTNKKKASFALFDGKSLPVEITSAEKPVTKIFTVNTLTFWEEPVKLLKDLRQCLGNDGNGRLVFGMTDKQFMLTENPFYTSEIFKNVYDEEEMTQFAAAGGFAIEQYNQHRAQARPFQVAVLKPI